MKASPVSIAGSSSFKTISTASHTGVDDKMLTLTFVDYPGVTSSWASCEVKASKGTRGSDNNAVPEISSGSRFLYPVRGVVCQPEKNEATPGVRAVVSGNRIDHEEAGEGGGSVKADQIPWDKLWRAIKSAFICFGQAREDIALYCLIGDDVDPYRINYCDDPISSRARQFNGDIAEVPRASDRNENVASSMMTAPLIKSGPCAGKRGHQHI